MSVAHFVTFVSCDEIVTSSGIVLTVAPAERCFRQLGDDVMSPPSDAVCTAKFKDEPLPKNAFHCIYVRSQCPSVWSQRENCGWSSAKLGYKLSRWTKLNLVLWLRFLRVNRSLKDKLFSQLTAFVCQKSASYFLL